MVDFWSLEYKVEVEHYPDGQPHVVRWTKDGDLDCHHGPAITQYDEQGRVLSMMWYGSGYLTRRRDGGPAVMMFNPENGVVTAEMYYVNGTCHRLGGQPAKIFRKADTGEVYRVEYWEYDTRIKKPRGPALGP
jgi:hypothetical protein